MMGNMLSDNSFMKPTNEGIVESSWQCHHGCDPCVYYGTPEEEPFNPMHGDVDKITVPELNPGSEGQTAYMAEVMNIIKCALNDSGIQPYYDPEPEGYIVNTPRD